MTTIAFVNAHTSSYMCRVHLRINIASFINVDVFKRFDYFFTWHNIIKFINCRPWYVTKILIS